MTTAVAEPKLTLADRAKRLVAGLDDVVDYRALVPLRIAAGFLLLVHLQPFLTLSLDGRTYRDVFWLPYGAWYPQPPDAVYVAGLWLAVVAAVAVSLGLFTRVATAYAAGFVVFNLFLSQTHYHHNRAFLAVLLLGLAVVPSGGAVSIDAWRGRRRGQPTTTRGVRWPLMLLRFQVAVVYVASGFSKLIDPDWFGGTVTQLRVQRDMAASGGGSLPTWLIDVLTDPAVHWGAAKIIVLTELFIGLGFLIPKTRLGAVWVAIPFHIIIELTAEVQVFSYAALAALVIWVTPIAHDRVLRLSSADPSARRLGAAVRGLDWTGRFRVESVDSRVEYGLVERDGSLHEGADAGWRIASRLPATFWVAGPIVLIRGWRRPSSG